MISDDTIIASREELILRVVNSVFEELKSRGIPPDRRPAERTVAADIGDNIANCTVEVVELEGIITARKLEDCSAVRIVPGSIITPSARDFIKDRKIRLIQDQTGLHTSDGAASAWSFWSSCKKLLGVPKELDGNRNVSLCPVPKNAESLTAALQFISAGITGQTLAAAIMIVETSPRALHESRIYPAIRAINGNFPKSIEDGVAQVQANLLVLEYAYLGTGAIISHINRFITLTDPATGGYQKKSRSTK